MIKYAIRRLLLVIPTIFLVSLVIFFLLNTLPGDVVITILYGSGEAAPTPEEVARLRADLGLDRALPIQYGDWMWGVIRGDLGYSYWTQDRVLPVLMEKANLSLELAILAMLISIVIAVPVGLLSAVKHGSWIDQFFRAFTVAGLAVPTFWAGIIILFILVEWFNWFPPIEYVKFLDDPKQNMIILIFPAMALGWRYMSSMGRMTRSMMLEVIREDYIRTARAKGLKERAVIVRHGLRNALLPVTTLSAQEFVILLSGAVAMEVVFSLPGLGKHLLLATFARDFITVQGIVIVMSLFVILLNLFVDLLYAFLDPRIRYG